MSRQLQNIINKNVLVIDDEVDLCMLIKSYLLRKNCRVRIAHTMEDAFEAIRKEAPEVVVLDRTLCKDLKEAHRAILQAAPEAQLIISG